MNDLRSWTTDLLRAAPPVSRTYTGWDSLPVPAFGALKPGVEAATLARNPSYEEVRMRKVPVLSDFGVASPSELTTDQLGQIESRLSAYFHQPAGPTTFFEKLAPIAMAACPSFKLGSLVHLDLSPWPTEKPWTALAPGVRNELLVDGIIKLVELLKVSDIKRLFINGADTYTELRKGFELARRRNFRLGDAPYAPPSSDNPLVECELTLLDPSGDRRIQICYWVPFVYAGHRGSTSDIEQALRNRFG